MFTSVPQTKVTVTLSFIHRPEHQSVWVSSILVKFQRNHGFQYIVDTPLLPKVAVATPLITQDLKLDNGQLAVTTGAQPPHKDEPSIVI